VQAQQIATALGASVEGDGSIELNAVATLEDATPSQLSFVANEKAAKNAAKSQAGCLLVFEAFDNATGRTVIRVKDARMAVAAIIGVLHPTVAPPAGIHPTAVVASSAQIDASASIGPHCSVGENVVIGAKTVLHASVTLYSGTRIGANSIVHAGCVIGADGFGFVRMGDSYRKFPQVGHVEIGDYVELGANTCIDRAALGVTRIGDGTKLDNMVHIGHNCQIGKHVLIAAQTGLAGGVVVEDYAILGGQVGIGDKVRIESGAVLGSGAGVLTSKIVRKGSVMWGTPARPLKEYLEQLAVVSRLARKRNKKPGTA